MNKIKKIILFSCFAGIFGWTTAQPIVELHSWLEKGRKGKIEKQDFAKIPLSKVEADSAKKIVYRFFQERERLALQHEWVTKCMRVDTFLMPFDYKVYGNKPENGRSLYISMHGGGGTTSDINDGQWLNQLRLYKPEEGVYLAPRAAVDAWNMWHLPHVSAFFDRIIRAAVQVMDVNPDKVYVLGYSAGGDGVYRVAPRMADRWAAASMMAGHPGGVSLLNVRNIGFMLWMGAEDGAYNRNGDARTYGQWLDSMSRADKGGYPHETHLVEGKGHWMDRADTAAIPWMARFSRNPYPEKIAWKQDDQPNTSFYWIRIPEKETKNGKTIIVKRQGNTFYIEKNDYKTIFIGVNDAMIDFEQPVTVIANGQTVFHAKVNRVITDIYSSIETRKDKKMIFDAYIRVDIARQ
ncbi:MAG: alpha/beta hydrolase [Bacteroidales bacterium]|jgi:hypothetical protein|nr:alpha/beta hydrolase [Bacteroidales bacterium]